MGVIIRVLCFLDFSFFAFLRCFLLRAGGPEFEIQRGARFFGPIKTGLKPTQSPMQGVPGSFPRRKVPGRGADHPPLLAPKLSMGSDIPVSPLSA